MCVHHPRQQVGGTCVDSAGRLRAFGWITNISNPTIANADLLPIPIIALLHQTGDDEVVSFFVHNYRISEDKNRENSIPVD
jgi:hypothetical protein